MNPIYDAIIVGGGPAGLSAAIYMARAKFSVLVIEKEKFGGQITITSEVVNYPGVIETSGSELTEKMRIQAQNFGAEFLSATVKEMNLKDELKTIVTDKGTYQSVGVILATGSSPRKIGFEGEKEFQGHGVAYCATCDGEFFTGMDVFVIGGGFAAAEEAMFLTKYARHVTIIVREGDFSCAKTIADKVKADENIDVHYHTEIVRAKGDSMLREATFKNNQTNEEWTYTPEGQDSFGIFVFAGYQPASELFKDQVELNPQGNLITDINQKTNVDGVYGAGDVCVKNLRQVVTAVSDGAVAATSLEKYIPDVVERLHIETKDLVTREVKKEVKQETPASAADDGAFINAQIKQQLAPILDRLQKPIILSVASDDSSFAKEMVQFAKEFSALHDLMSYEVVSGKEPGIYLYNDQKEYLRVCFHAVPGGHEFNSFVIAVYNAVGPKQAIDEETLQNVLSMTTKHHVKVVVSLSCTMCPELVMASNRIALENENIEVEVFDFAHYKELKERYKIMSVPAMIVDDEQVYFGKKDINQLYELLK